MTLSDSEVEGLLSDWGIVVDGKQSRPIARDDLKSLLQSNGGNAEYLNLRGLDISGADLRGLCLEKAYLEGCNFSDSIAMPLVISKGAELNPGDLAYGYMLGRWRNDDLRSDVTVARTSFKESFLTWSDFSGSDLRWVDFSEAYLGRANLENASLNDADLRGAVLDGTNLRDADLRNSNFRGAHLSAARMETSLLEGIDWGPHNIVSEEQENQLGEAEQIYRTLKRIYQNAGELNLAGYFHYREEVCRRKIQFSNLLNRSTLKPPAGQFAMLASGLFHGGWGNLKYWLHYCLMEQLFGYGERPWRVARAAILLIFSFSFAFVQYSTIELSLDGFIEFLRQLGNGLYFSATSFTALGYGPWISYSQSWTRYLGVIESFVGVFLLALFLVTFTRRWTR